MLGEEPETSDHLMSSDTAGALLRGLVVTTVWVCSSVCRLQKCELHSGLVGIDLGVDVVPSIRSADFVPGCSTAHSSPAFPLTPSASPA